MLQMRNGKSALRLWGPLVVVALILSGCANESYPDNLSVATVNGQVVEAQEFIAVLMNERSKTYAYFQDKYGAEAGPAFWNRDFGGETPLDKLTKDVLREIVDIKVVQSLGLEYGLLRETSYSAFLDELKQENERRAEEARNGRPVYGPKQLTETTFYDMRQAQLAEDLKRKIGGNEAVSEQDVQTYYDRNRQQFASGGTTKVNLIAIPFGSADGLSKEEAESSMDSIIARLEAGETFSAVTSGYCQSLPSAFLCREQVFGADTAKADVMTTPRLATAVNELEKGEISEVIEEHQTLLLAKGVDKQPGAVMPLEQARDSITAQIRSQSFDRWLQDRIDDARLELDEEVMRGVAVSVLQGK